MSKSFQIEFLDHVAIRVANVKNSAKWYEEVLGLKKYEIPERGPYPVFMLAGKTGLALFPANPEDPEIDPFSRNIRIDHFAFNLTKENFKKAKERYRELNISYSFSDHHYFHSIYTKDPDGHTVELTTLVVDENTFY
jgi:catechol-2,3-dioxygenase